MLAVGRGVFERLRGCRALIFALFCSCSPARSDPPRADLPDAPADADASADSTALGDATDPSHVGQPCIPTDEEQPYFGSFELTEVAVGLSAPDCGGNACLSNHFQGRVTCPYGQSQAEADGLGTRPESELCHVTGSDADRPRVAAAVLPQLSRRRPADAVYCTCHCAGPDPDEVHCACPDGFRCIELLRPLGPWDPEPGEGSYCVKISTDYDPTMNYGPICQMGDAGELPCGQPSGG
jgi:hypothetical protein